MDSNTHLEKLKNILNQLIEIYKEIQVVLQINTNEVFFQEVFTKLINNKIVQDVVSLLNKHNNYILKLTKIPDEDDLQLRFHQLSIILEDLCNSDIIEDNTPKDIIKYKNKKKKGFKKKHEVENLVPFIKDIIRDNNVKILIEIGCGKSYLTDKLFETEDILYIGIDKRDDLIEKTKIKKINNSNIKYFNQFVDKSNFQQFYQTNLEKDLKDFGLEQNNSLLFGLHACGNLTSDSIKIFVDNKCFSNLSIIGCCFHFIKELISEGAKSTQNYNDYVKGIGYNLKGEYLDNTIKCSHDDVNIGFPLSQYVKEKLNDCFLGRTARSNAVSSLTSENSCVVDSDHSIYYRKCFYRSLYQAYLSEYFPCLGRVYGFENVYLNNKDTFVDYVSNMNKALLETLSDMEYKIEDIEAFKDYMNINNDIIQSFFNEKKKYEVYFWAVNVIAIKLAKVIEMIITIDRCIYLKESGVEEVKLMKMFNPKVSSRNLMIYAKK